MNLKTVLDWADYLDKRHMHKKADIVFTHAVRVAQQGNVPYLLRNTSFGTATVPYREQIKNEYNAKLQSHFNKYIQRLPPSIAMQINEKIRNALIWKQKHLENQYRNIDELFSYALNNNIHPSRLWTISLKLEGFNKMIPIIKKMVGNDNLANYIIYSMQVNDQSPEAYFDKKMQEYIQAYNQTIQQHQYREQQIYQDAQQQGILPQLQQTMRTYNIGAEEAYQMLMQSMYPYIYDYMGNRIDQF